MKKKEARRFNLPLFILPEMWMKPAIIIVGMFKDSLEAEPGTVF
jgi:hypothetical protein